MQNDNLTEENRERIKRTRDLIGKNNDDSDKDIGNVSEVGEFKKLNKKANTITVLSVLTAIIVISFGCFLAGCLIPCEGERCHSCLISFFLFVPICFFWTALPLSIAVLMLASSIKKSIAQATDNLITTKIKNKRKASLYILLCPFMLLVLIYIIYFIK